MVLSSVVDGLWNRSLSHTTTVQDSITRTVYEAGFRAFAWFSDLYPSGSLSPTHPAVTEKILIYFVAHCFSFLQLKHSTIKTYLAGMQVFRILVVSLRLPTHASRVVQDGRRMLVACVLGSRIC